MNIALDLPSDSRAPTLAREALAAWRGVLPEPVGDDVALIVTELVTNSVQHGPGNPIRVRVSLSPDGILRGEIADDGDGEVLMRAMGDNGGGLGLQIVDRLSDRWGVFEGSTHVWFEIAVPGGPSDPAA